MNNLWVLGGVIGIPLFAVFCIGAARQKHDPNWLDSLGVPLVIFGAIILLVLAIVLGLTQEPLEGS